MRAVLFTGAVVGALIGAVAGTATAQSSGNAAPAAPAGTPADTAAAKAAPAPPLAGLKLSGFAEASYAYSSRAVGRTIPGRLFDRYQDQFELNAIKVALDRPYAADRFDAGVHADVLVGQNATVLRSTGFNLGDQGDITQLYITLNIPTPNGNGLQLKAGKMVTLLGQEVLEDVANPSWSEGNQFIYVENFTATGLSVEYRLSRYLDTQLRVTNGWDAVQAINDGKSLMARVGVYPDSASTVALVGYYGAEQPNTARPKRYGGELLLNRQLGGRAAVAVQADYGREGAGPALPDSTRDAVWWAAGAWLTYTLGPAAQLALRGDYVDDITGARTSGVLGFPVLGAQRLGSATLTLNLRTWPHTLVRPEVRYDRSSASLAFAGRRQQASVAVSVAYLY